jgi:hypothetical protein
MEITQSEPLFAQSHRRRSRYKDLIDLLETAPTNTWYSIRMDNVGGETAQQKQSNILGCCTRWFETGTVQTHVEGDRMFVRRVGTKAKRSPKALAVKLKKGEKS